IPCQSRQIKDAFDPCKNPLVVLTVLWSTFGTVIALLCVAGTVHRLLKRRGPARSGRLSLALRASFTRALSGLLPVACWLTCVSCLPTGQMFCPTYRCSLRPGVPGPCTFTSCCCSCWRHVFMMLCCWQHAKHAWT